MTAPPFIADRLWHSLCPAYARLASGTRRALLNTSTRRPKVLYSKRAQLPTLCTRHPTLAGPPSRSFVTATQGLPDSEQKDSAPVPQNEFDSVDTEKLYNRLRQAAANGDVDSVDRTVYYLLAKRGEEPNLALYSAAILSNISAEQGSMWRATSLLREMGHEGLEPTAEICHNMLKVAAAHPDYLVRDAMVEYMRQRWFTISADGRHDIVVGLLRETQFEMALQQMDSMVAEGVQIKSWLSDMAIYMLCDIKNVDEAFRLMLQKVNSGEQRISKPLWNTLLDAASSTHHLAAINYVWKRQVAAGHLIPSSGVCFNILGVAARAGDAELATEVFRVLTERKEVFTQQHYELLVDTYIESGDIQTALTVLCIMRGSGTPSDEFSTRKLFKWTAAQAERPIELFETLRRLKDEGYTVPVSAVNVLIEAAVSREDLDTAIDIYKAMHAVCDDGPSTTTFNVLFRGCDTRKDLAMFLAAEMVERKVEPDALTYDRLLLVCLMEKEDYDDAFRYYEEMRSRGWVPRVGTFLAMARRCARAHDLRAYEVVEEMQACNMDPQNIRFVKDWLHANWDKVSEADEALTR